MAKLDKYILVIDDSKQYQLLYKTYLNKIFGDNIDVKSVSSSKDALEALNNSKIPDLILLDYILPDINGIDTLKKIRTSDFYKDTPILFLTGYGDEHVAKEALKNGADDYLIKSEINEQSLEKSIKSIFENYLEKKREILLQKKIEKKAMYDHLTGVSNRFQFEEIISGLLRSGRKDDITFSMFLFDIDNFKIINDSFGHHDGDLVLKEFVRRVSKAIREKDVLARLGGDEFALLIRGVDDVNDINTVAEKIYSNFKSPFKISSEEINVTISIGISRCPSDAENLKDIFSSADKALYHAKYKGKNQYQLFSDLEYSKLSDKVEITQLLIKDIEMNNIAIEYDFLYQSNNLKEQEITSIIPCNIYSKSLQSKVTIDEVFHSSKKNNKSTFVQKKLIDIFFRDYSNILSENIEFCLPCTVDYLVDTNAFDYIQSTLIDYNLKSNKIVLIIEEEDLVYQHERIPFLIEYKRDSDIKIYLSGYGLKFLALRPMFELEVQGVLLDIGVLKDVINNNIEQENLISLIEGRKIKIIADKITSDYDIALMNHYGVTNFAGEYFRTINGAKDIKDYKS